MTGKARNEEKSRSESAKTGVNEAMEVLEHRHRRDLLEHLASVDDTITFTEAAQTLAASDRLSAEDVRFDLYHLHLPKLERLGLVEFDERSEEIRYRPDVRVEALLDTIGEWW